MQATTDRHHQITCGILPEPNGIFDNAAPLDRADDVFNPHTAVRNDLILGFLRLRSLLSTRLFMWLGDLDAFEREADKAKVLPSFTPFRQRIGCLVRNGLVVGAPFVGITQKWNTTALVSQQDIFYGVPLFLAAIPRFLLIVIFGAGDWSFTPVVKKRVGASAWLA